MGKNQINELIVNHIGFSEKIARLNCKRFPRLTYDELKSAAYMGLVIAANNYKEERKTKFTTFAHFKINKAILNYVRENFPSKKKNIFISLNYCIENHCFDKAIIQKPEKIGIQECLMQGLNEREGNIFIEYYVNCKRNCEIAMEAKLDKSRITQVLTSLNKKIITNWGHRKFELYQMIN